VPESIRPHQHPRRGAPSSGDPSPHDLLRNLAAKDESEARLAATWICSLNYWAYDPHAARCTVTALLALSRSPSWDVARTRALRAYDLTNAAFERGLCRRLGQYVEPVLAPLDPMPTDDELDGVLLGVASSLTKAQMLSFRMIRDLRQWAWVATRGEVQDGNLVAQPGEPPSTVKVCQGCKIVFEPSRTDAKVCDRCRATKRVPFPSSFLPIPAHLRRGDTPAPLRAPVIGLNGELLRWRTVYVGRCVGCGRHFMATRKDARVCPGSGSCEQKKRRRDAP
jgi:hypothetical protein